MCTRPVYSRMCMRPCTVYSVTTVLAAESLPCPCSGIPGSTPPLLVVVCARSTELSFNTLS